MRASAISRVPAMIPTFRISTKARLELPDIVEVTLGASVLLRDLSRGDAHTHIHRLRGGSKSADRNKVDSRFGIGANIVELDAAGTFHRNPLLKSRAIFHGFTNILNRHVVEQKCLGTMLYCLLHLLECAHHNLDGLGAAPVAMGAFEGRNNATCQSDVIVLDQYAIGEIQPVILASTTADSVLVDRSQSRIGLTSVEDARLGSMHRIHELS